MAGDHLERVQAALERMTLRDRDLAVTLLESWADAAGSSGAPSQESLPGLPPKPTPWLRVLPKVDFDGDEIGADEKWAWWQREEVAIQAWTDKELKVYGKSPDDSQERNAILKSVIIRFFNRYLSGPRPYRGMAQREALENAAEAFLDGQDDPSRGTEAERPSQRIRHREM